MATKTLQPFRLQTRLEVDAKQHHAEYQKAEAEVKKYGVQVVKTGKEAANAFKGAEVGRKWGSDFGASAVSAITGSISSIGQTLGAVIGTAIAPGIGTAIGSTLGSGIDAAMQKVSGPIIATITQGIELNKEIEKATVHFTTFAGSEKEAKLHLAELQKLSEESGLRMGVLIQGSERLEEFTGDLKLTRVILKAAADQSAAFGSGAEGFDQVANALGRITLKGELTSKLMLRLEQQAIHVKKYLAEGFGYSEKKIDELIKAGRIHGDVAARLIAEGIEREKGGYAAKIGATTTGGAEAVFGARSEILAARGTQQITRAEGDVFRQANAVFASPQAEKFVAWVDKTSGSLINLVEKGLKAGLNLGQGIAEGINSGESLQAMSGAFTKLRDWTGTTLGQVFEMKSPSEFTAREIGEPLGEGIGIGMVRRFQGFMKNEGADAIRAELEQLLADPRIKAFFDAIQRAEGGAPNRIVGGRTVSDLSRHPNIVGVRTAKGPSTAFGSYQITGSNWYGTRGHPGLQQRLALTDASAHSQQLAAALMFADRDGGAGIRALLAGDIETARRVAAKDWTSTPGSTIGGGRQKSVSQWMGYYNAALGGKPVDAGNPMPVYVVDIQGGAALLNRQGPRRIRRAPGELGTGGELAVGAGVLNAGPKLNPELPKLDENLTLVAGDVRDVTTAFMQIDPAIHRAQFALATIGLGLPPIMKGVNDAGQETIVATKQIIETNRRLGIETIGLAAKLAGAIGQVAGMIPSQQVGKKRGFFSKLLGFAAPFLAFIPGFGPILSQIAGMASNALGGNWSGFVSGLAGGLSPGGVFRPAPPSAPPSAPPGGTRAIGGPVNPGTPYLVGEHGQEWFVPSQSGQVYPNGTNPPSAATSPDLMEVLHQMARALNNLHSMPPDHVVMQGAHGLLRRMDADAGMANQMGRRMNFA